MIVYNVGHFKAISGLSNNIKMERKVTRYIPPPAIKGFSEIKSHIYIYLCAPHTI